MSDYLFIIDGKLTYREADFQLWRNDFPEDMTAFSIIPGRLLSFLLHNPGRVISRNELLSEIWEQHGLIPSGSSLSQNISLLRKTFASYQCDAEVIQTLPRVGFFINESHIEKLKSRTITQPSPQEATPLVAPVFNNKKKWIISISASWIVALGLLLISESNIPFYGNSNLFKTQNLFHLGEAGTCPIYSTTTGSEAMNKKRLAISQENINKQLPCVNGAMYINFEDDPLLLKGKGHFFITMCLKISGEKQLYSGCETIYAKDYKKAI